MKQFIKCPNCDNVEMAETKESVSSPTNRHHCSCGHTITESEWEALRALSLKQPWAWLIVHGFKDLENRSTLKNFRGTFLIHASKQWDAVGASWILNRYDELGLSGTKMPALQREAKMGGIIGYATITDSITKSDSLWFFGPNAFVIQNPHLLEFSPCRGQLGFFTPIID